MEQSNKQKIKEAVLERIKVGLNVPFDSYFIQELNVDVIDRVGEIALVEIRTAFMGQRKKIYREVGFDVPLNWYQIFKEKHFPEWALKIFPIKTKYLSKTFEFDASVIFPNIKNIKQDINLFIQVSDFDYGK